MKQSFPSGSSLNQNSSTETFQSSPSNSQNLYQNNQKDSSRVSQRNKDEGIGNQEKQFSLSAPYDLRPRKLVSLSPSESSLQQVQLSETLSHPENEIGKRRRREKKGSVGVRKGQTGSRRPETLLFDQAQESAGEEVVSNEDGAFHAGLDTESMSPFETSDLIQSNQKEEENSSGRNKQEESEVYATPSGQLVRSIEQQQLQQVNEPNELQQVTSGPEFGYFGARKNSGQVQQTEAKHEVGNQEQEYLVGGSQPLSGPQEEDGNVQQEMSMLEQPQQAEDSNDTRAGQLESSDEINNSNQQIQFKGAALINDTQSDESFLTAKLPSQYDAVIRMPPEGYYDDYFKPVSSNVAMQATPSQSSLENTSEFSFNQAGGENNGRGQSEQMEIEPEGITNSSRQNHNYETSNTGFIPIEYTKQFYANQRPVKQNELVQVEQTVELFPQPNETSAIKKPEVLNYELPPAYTDNNYNSISAHQNEHLAPNNSQVRMNNQSYEHELRNSNSNYLGQNDDSIQVIIANTNNSRDPLSNEKVINYTSDGKNITRLAGKPARNTFVNKDMNEFPPPDEQTFHSRDTLSGVYNENQKKSTQQDYGNQQPEMSDEGAFRQQVRPGQLEREQTSSAQQTQPPRQSNEVSEEEVSDQRTEGEPEEEMRRVNNNNYGGYSNNKEPDSATISPKLDTNSSKDYHENYLKERRQKGDMERHDERAASRGHKSNQNQARLGNKQHRNRLSKQQTVRRPQVTQAHFNPKDLIANPPTPSPSITESTIESIAELPNKVKRLREKQPDKNELMNELLTALDRVKVAIYKLQPLTAKMNAIYRKSVTSNTRDIIMDNHKGTYAKRYPPGDYDDTYDRMHPSELISRQRSSNRRARRVAGSSTNNSMEAQESAGSAVYLPAPKDVLESYERNQVKSRLRIGSTESEPSKKSTIEIQNLGESQLVATGIGRRLGPGRVRGQFNVTSSKLSFDDDDEDELKANSNQTQGTGESKSSNSNSNSSDSVFDSAAPNFVPVKQLLEDSQSPLFGYRITIFQAPEAESEEARELFSYTIDGLDSDSPERFGESEPANDEIETNMKPSAESSEKDDLMATSESSLIEQQVSSPSSVEKVNSVEEPDESESEKKVVKESEKEKKGHKEEGKKKKEGSKKSSSKKKKHESESKKKKEYKKIKHKKGVISKEKKSMKRDKHIKAHDRGAAKEKALKERTQIEFFEREQIVDDEFEKGKKSTMKAGWETGHDSKKTMKDHSSGDPISMGGSHYVAHQAKEKHLEKGAGLALAASSGKKSNKFEKKHMDAKGKKFKGWREKGYKIITETEFIDRGKFNFEKSHQQQLASSD